MGLLSGGERSRLLFLALSLAEYSLLMLDEPTNHLDIEGKEQLEDALNQYKGALLMVSHDRKITEETCNRFWVIKNKTLNEYNSYSDLCRYIHEDDEAIVVPKSYKLESETHTQEVGEDELLERLILLENKLSEEKKRKPKHQKIHVQSKLNDEIGLIKRLLNI